MSQPAIVIEGLWKEYFVGPTRLRNRTLYDALTKRLASPWRRRDYTGSRDAEHFWALRDVSFKVDAGDVLGVVGSNGAGKSTLLKVLSRITAPTRGRVTVRGRLASLLEVGTGFHPELSGLENIHLNATILGMGKQEIARKLDAIISFSGVEKFIDMPVKRYSSGMYVRLAFAVAAHVEAEILLIDEVLAVGDAEFQKRCLGMMGDVARAGRTVVFVSHNLTALRNLCTTGVLLKHGRPELMGSIGDVLNRYAADRGGGTAAIAELTETPTGAVALIRRVEVLAADSKDHGQISVSSRISIKVRVEVPCGNPEIGVFIHCHDANQNRVFSTGSFFAAELNGLKLSAGQHEFVCCIPANVLNDGEYSLDVMLLRDRSEVILTENALVSFQIHDEPLGVEGWNWSPVGMIRPKLEWSLSAPSISVRPDPDPTEPAPGLAASDGAARQ